VPPCGPCGPCGPTGPLGPAGPVAPDGPVAPVAPMGPTGPAGPAGPWIGPISTQVVPLQLQPWPVSAVIQTSPGELPLVGRFACVATVPLITMPVPCGPLGPTGPAGPTGPCAPPSPGLPLAPGGPAGPAGPGGPGGPGTVPPPAAPLFKSSTCACRSVILRLNHGSRSASTVLVGFTGMFPFRFDCRCLH
jgi:hypothetical protein